MTDAHEKAQAIIGRNVARAITRVPMMIVPVDFEIDRAALRPGGIMAFDFPMMTLYRIDGEAGIFHFVDAPEAVDDKPDPFAIDPQDWTRAALVDE